MKNILDILTGSKVQYLATLGLDGKPKVRPFQFMFEEEGKLWFCTSNKKEVYKELQKQPYIELCASGQKMSWVRIEAKVIFSENIEIKKKVFEVSPLVKGIYKDPNNSKFEIFYLDEVTASFSELGKQAKIIKI